MCATESRWGGPAQVREYSPDDPLTNADRRGELLCDRLTEVGALRPGAVLDLGCGYGGLTLALRKRGHEVWSLDRDLKNLDIVKGRLREASLPQNVAQGSAVTLPFPDDRFDTVVMVGVLEWIGFSSPHGDPRDLQRAALREVRRVLRPDGRIILATKNRLFPRFAWKDAQLNLPVLNLLPRKLADWTTQRLRGYGYRAPIYSARGWERLLAEAGLIVDRAWTARYTYQYPLALVPFESRGSRHSVVEERVGVLNADEQREALLSPVPGARTRYYNVIEGLGLQRHLSMSLIFLAGPSVETD